MGTPMGTMDHTRTLTHQYTQTRTAGVGLHVGTRVMTCHIPKYYKSNSVLCPQLRTNSGAISF